MIRLKNHKANEARYIEAEKNAYDTIVSWLNTNITEESKSKCKIVQSKLLDFFKTHKKPTSTKVQTLLKALKAKYLSSSYPTIKFTTDIATSIFDEKALLFNIYLNFNGYYSRQVIRDNHFPSIDGKPEILDIEITKSELNIAVEQKAIKDGGFEEA